MTSAEIAGLRDFISVEFGKVHDRVDQVNAAQLDFQAHVATHFGEVYTRLSRVEIQQEEMRSDFRAFGEGLQSTNRRIDELRSDMDRGFLGLREEMREGFRVTRRRANRG